MNGPMMMLASMLGLKPDELFATAKEMQEKFSAFVEAAQRIDAAQQANAASLILLHRKIDALLLQENPSLIIDGLPVTNHHDGVSAHDK